MPAISKRGMEMPASPIRKLVPYAEAAKKRGTHVYHLNIGQPDIQTPPSMFNALKKIKHKVIEYSHSAGIPSYREKLSAYYKQHNIFVSPEEIIVTAGGSEALLFAMWSVLNPGDEVIIPEPFYANYNGFAIATGAKVIPVVSSIDNSFALPPIEEFEKLITPRTKAIIVCNPNNPTGYLYTKEELQKLAELIKKHDLYLIADEVYREFCYDGSQHFSVMHLEGVESNILLADSVSKRYSACGIRVGNLVTKNKEVINAAMKFAQARLSPPSLGQFAAEAALDEPQAYFDKVIGEYVARRDVLLEGLNKIKGVVCPKPKGAFYCVAQLPVDDSDKFCQWLLEDFSYKGRTVMFAPASGFYSTEGAGKNEIRISYVLNTKDLKRSVKCLEEALKVYPGKTK